VGTPSPIAARTGQRVRISAVIQAAPYARVVSLQLVVGPSTATADIASPGTPEADASIVNSAHQIASTEVRDLVPGGQRLAVTFNPTSAGSYRVFDIERYVSSSYCEAPAPADAPPGEVATAVAVLGDVQVS
jgi:hypothetical protein